MVRLQNIGRGEFLDDNKAFISLDHFRKLHRHSVREGDVIVAALGDGARPAGRACLVPVGFGNGVVKADCFRLRLPADVLDPPFLIAFLNSPTSLAHFSAEMRGATRPRVTLGMLRELRVPLPPLAEQQRIAARLGEQLAAAETARAAVAAQLAAARRLPSALLETTFASEEADRWPRQRLGGVLVLRNDIVHPRDRPKGRAQFVGLEHIEPHTGRRLGAVSVEQAELTGRKGRFLPGDIVYGYLRPYLNKVWIAEFAGLCSVDQYVYRVAPDRADTRFVAWFLRSPTYLQRAPVDVSPGQLPRIRMDEVAAVEIGLPPLSTQLAVATRLDTELAAAAALRASLETRLRAVEKLPAALLREVFDDPPA